MPSMMENIVMKKCKVKFKLARTIVTDARNNMPQENRNCLWSKALEEECLKLYYDQYGVKLGLTRPTGDPMGESNHTQDTTSTFSLAPTDSLMLPKQRGPSGDYGEGALKKSRSIGKIKLRPQPIVSPVQTSSDKQLRPVQKTPTKPSTSPSLRSRRTLTEQTSFPEVGVESEWSERSSSRRSRSVSKKRVKKDKNTESDQLDLSSHSNHSTKSRRVKRDKSMDNDQLDLSDHSSKSTSSKSKSKSKKKSGKTATSILDIDSAKKTTPRKKSITKKNAFNAADVSDSFFDMEVPMSPSLANYISSPPAYTSPKQGQRLTAGMKGLDVAATSRDTTPFKPKVDKSPKKTPRRKSVSMSKKLPDEMLGAEPAIRRALQGRKDNVNSGKEATSPTRILIRCKRSKPKSPDKSFRDDDDQSIGPEDLLKHTPERKPTGSMVSLNNSRFHDGNSSRTRMVPVVRQSSGGNSPAQKRRSSKLRNSFRKEEDSPHMSGRQSRSSSAPESSLFSEGFLVSPSRETSMDNFQSSSAHGCLTRQNSADSFLSIESFSGTSDSSPFDSPVHVPLSGALPKLPTLSPVGKDDCHIAFDSETVSSSLAAPKKPKRQSSNKPSWAR